MRTRIRVEQRLPRGEGDAGGGAPAADQEPGRHDLAHTDPADLQRSSPSSGSPGCPEAVTSRPWELLAEDVIGFLAGRG
jgi:hypothetical protein